MNSKETRQFIARWERVEQFVAEEALHTPLEVKLWHLALMFEAAQELGRNSKLRMDKMEVYTRWQLLREKLGSTAYEDRASKRRDERI